MKTKLCKACQEQIAEKAIKCKHCGEKQPVNFWENPWFFYLLLILLISVIIDSVFSPDSIIQNKKQVIIQNVTNNEKEKNNDIKTIAYKLSSFDYKSGFSPTESSVVALQFGLDELKNKCPKETEETLGDMLYITYKNIKEKINPNVGMGSVIDGINQSIPKEASGIIDCKEIMAAYVALQIK